MTQNVLNYNPLLKANSSCATELFTIELLWKSMYRKNIQNFYKNATLTIESIKF